MTVESRLAKLERHNRVLTGTITIAFLVGCSGLLLGRGRQQIHYE